MSYVKVIDKFQGYIDDQPDMETAIERYKMWHPIAFEEGEFTFELVYGEIE
ncbi:MAG: hypothetical protein LBI13_11210 [Streptococcaceae bacterium]|jgi:hypothetical protein|nr:hypothetical protein [Streptococcaceae bacterium]